MRVRHSVTPPLPKKVRFYLTVTWATKSGKTLSWRYAVDFKERRIDGAIIPLVDYLDDSAPKGRRYVGRFDFCEPDTSKAILMGVDSEFKSSDLVYRAASWALQRLSWGADPATLPVGTRIDIEMDRYSTDADLQEMLVKVAMQRKAK